MKFGGTSVGTDEAIQHVIQIIQRERPKWDSIAIVTSAMGGVTDKLVGLVGQALTGNPVQDHLTALHEHHLQMVDSFIDRSQHPSLHADLDIHITRLIQHLEEQSQHISHTGEADARTRDAIFSTGERIMAPILAAILQVNGVASVGIDASQILMTDNRHQNARPQFAASLAHVQQKITPLLENGTVPVITGYIGAAPDGAITTLGRGGSDYSAAYLARLLETDEVWIWTDVDGVMSADPRKIKNATVIEAISYEQVSELAYFGAKVLHPRTMQPLIEPHIPLYVRNTFNSTHPGTRINSAHPMQARHLSAVTAVEGVLVFLPNAAELPAGAPPMLDLTHQILNQHLADDPFPVITMDSHAGRLLCYVVPTTASRDARDQSIAALLSAFEQHYPGVSGCRVEPISIVAAIGVVDIKQTMQVLNAVKAIKADLLAMGHGSPECTLLVVPPPQAPRVLRRLHNMAAVNHANLPYAENDPLLHAGGGIPAIPSIPNGKRQRSRRNSRRPRSNRSIPL